jgi:hypothetical protein
VAIRVKELFDDMNRWITNDWLKRVSRGSPAWLSIYGMPVSNFEVLYQLPAEDYLQNEIWLHQIFKENVNECPRGTL